ncbi:MAG: SWIM zinc finger family protein [Thermoguttaceae bacterium]|jgi:hypothetical protein|nr:SWIM zinc finger family protein [Thermoguttaceae bacterium]
MTTLALDYVYRYLHESVLDRPEGCLRLATFSDAEEAHPYFFRGDLVRPRRTADLLRGLMRVVQTRFHVPPAMLGRILAMADPVVTCSDDRVRFEAFSGCCGVYARIDLLPSAVSGETFGRGTTNVDFNQAMLSALAMVRGTDAVSLCVGADELALSRNRSTVVEKKVKLPVRWLKGFVEVQACQGRMQHVLEVPGVEAMRFLRSLPRMKTGRRETWVAPIGRGLRLSQRESPGAVRVGGLERLRVLENLAPQARTLRVFSDPSTGASAWQLDFDDCRFHLVISPEVWRGFSGEGQALGALASEEWRQWVPKIRAALKWEAVIDLDQLTAKTGASAEAVRRALAALGARGLVGFDLSEGAYFHRELPFDMALVEKLQPRLANARKLIAGGKVRAGARTAEEIEVFVAGSGVEHRVRLLADDARCTCPWFAKHGTARGPCKHILAARILLAKIEETPDE